MAKSKGTLIQQIIKITETEPTKHFDALSDKSEGYLTKLLKVCQAL